MYGKLNEVFLCTVIDLVVGCRITSVCGCEM